MPKIQFTVPSRQVVEQINLQVPSEFGGARQAAIACFHALDNGDNAPTTVFVNSDPGKLGIGIVKGEYVHGDPAIPEPTPDVTPEPKHGFRRFL